MPTISVIVPVYKAENLLEKCVDSILAQSFSDFELILVDDGSPDNSGMACDAYAAKDSRVVCIHKENGGVSAARNAGLYKAKGDFVLFVDSDDYVHPDMLRRLWENKSDLTLCAFTCRTQEGQTLFSVSVPDAFYGERKDIPYAELYQQNMFYSPYCKLFRTDILKEQRIRFPQEISWGEDGMFVADYLSHVDNLRILSDMLYYYIRYDNASSLSTRVRPEIVSMAVQGREYCIKKMIQTAPWAQEQVGAVCREDIRRNCADFVKMLLNSNAMSWKEKKLLLSKFLNNSYVSQTVRQAQRYYAKHGKVYTAIKKENADGIVSCYRRITRKERWFWWAYQRLYQSLPEWIKNIYRHLRGKEKKR